MPKPSTPVPESPSLTAEDQAALREAEEDISSGRVIPLEEVKAWVESWDTPTELPPPHQRWR